MSTWTKSPRPHWQWNSSWTFDILASFPRPWGHDLQRSTELGLSSNRPLFFEVRFLPPKFFERCESWRFWRGNAAILFVLSLREKNYFVIAAGFVERLLVALTGIGIWAVDDGQPGGKTTYSGDLNTTGIQMLKVCPIFEWSVDQIGLNSKVQDSDTF